MQFAGKIRKHSILVALISLSTLACLIVAMCFYSHWLQQRLRTTIHTQVLDDNVQTAQQLVRLIREMELDSLENEATWDRLQSVVEEIRLPNEGFVCVIDSHSGHLVCHPEIRANPSMRDLPVGQSSIIVKGVETTIIDAESAMPYSGVRGGVATLGQETQIVSIADVPHLQCKVLVHQRESGIERAIERIITPTQQLGLICAVAVAMVIALLNTLIVRRYENKLADINENLDEMVHRRTRSLTKTRNAVIFGLAKLSESRDNDTGQHLDRIRSYVSILARELRNLYPHLDQHAIDDLSLAASLHDIGKVGIPDDVLLKPSRFSSEERQVMERHSAIGGNCLQSIQHLLGDDDFLQLATEVAYFHHERWDGTGYPTQKAGPDIPLSARIVALADVYDALTSERPYKEGMSHEQAREIVVRGRGTHFDPDIVDAFIRVEEQFKQIANRYSTESTPAIVAQLTQELSDSPQFQLQK